MNGPRTHHQNHDGAPIEPLEGVTSCCRTCPVTLSVEAYQEVVDALRGAKPPKEREHLLQRLCKAVTESREVHMSIAREDANQREEG